MTAHRRPEIRYSDAPRSICRWCGEAILYTEGVKQGQPDLRRRWHPECVDAYNASDPREARRRVRKRDRGICAACGLDTRVVKKAHRGRGSARALRDLGYVPRRSLWELDHIVPLIDGGGHELANLQTLCAPCHKSKTAAEARTRAERERSTTVIASDHAIAAMEAHCIDGDAEAISANRPEPKCDRAPDFSSVPLTDDERRPKRRRRADARSDEPLAAILERATRLNQRVESALRERRSGS
jgi:5-methylcytosine-specific restriction protein A